MNRLLSATPISMDLGLLVYRLFIGALMLPHGWAKLSNFKERMDTFADPLGIGSALSLTGAITAEFFCSLLVMVGLYTRLALIPLLFTLAIICFVIHGADPIGEREKALMYFFSYVVLFFTGPGKYSVDGWRK